MNGIEDHKVRSLTIFPDLSSVQDFNTMGDSDSPVPNSWEFFDDAQWNGDVPTGKYKNRLISSFFYSQTVEPFGNLPTESIYSEVDYSLDEPGEPELEGHYEWNASNQLVENLDQNHGTLINWGGSYYTDVFNWD